MHLKDSSLLRNQCYIDGKWVAADSGAVREVNNPATGELLTTVPYAGAAETRRAIEAANRAQPAWRALLAKEREKSILSAALANDLVSVVMRRLSSLSSAPAGAAGAAADGAAH